MTIFDDTAITSDADAATAPSATAPAARARVDFDHATIDRLSDWATASGVADDPYVVAVVDAARDGDDLSALASLDPLEALPHPRRTEGRGLRRVARLLLVVRNVAIFVPVALTWLGIRQATAAFGRYTLTAGSEAPEQLNFLQFWQAGGPVGGPTYLAAEWRIQNIALLATVLIFGIVALTLLASGLSAAADARDDRAAASAERERMDVAVRLTRVLAPLNRVDQQVVLSAVRASLDVLVEASDGVGTSAKRLEAATTGLGSIVPHVDELGGRLQDVGSQLGHVTSSVESLGHAVHSLETAVGKDMSVSLEDAIAGLDEVREQLARTSASVEFGTKQLRDDLDAIHANLSGAIPAGNV